jgi:outer membrane protein assembly factor BamE (lipoprotein component of BamABCDE complex)
MKNVLRNRKAGFGLVFLLALSGFLVTSALAAGQVRYTKYNIHTQSKGNRLNASYANYVRPGAGHYIIPAGTEITILDRSRKEIVFRINGDGRTVHFQYHEPRMQMGVNEYIEEITSPKPVSLKNLSALDRKGVKQGEALVGMTRKGVMTALGYPATHKTPSPESPTWIYWTNRFGTLAVEFDKKGIVVAVRD